MGWLDGLFGSSGNDSGSGQGTVPEKGTAVQSSTPDTTVLVSGHHCRDGRERTDAWVIDKTTEPHEKAHFSFDGTTGEMTQHHGFEPQGKGK